MKFRTLALMILTGSAAFAAPRVFVGFSVGYAPVPVQAVAPPPPPVVAYVPPAPGPGCSWVAGYYAPVGPRWVWHGGYWARPPYPHAYWAAPRYYRGHYSRGYWRR
jgi:hypothetical protein